MRRLPLPRALLAALCLLAAGAGGAQSAGASHAGTGRIVFASDRGRADPGEIYSLGPGSAPRHVAPSPAAEYGLAVSPAGGRIAFWSGRTGGDDLYLARADGSHVRLVRGAGREPLRADGAGGGRLTFTADGRRLFGSGAGGAFAVDAGTALARSLPFCEPWNRVAGAGWEARGLRRRGQDAGLGPRRPRPRRLPRRAAALVEPRLAEQCARRRPFAASAFGDPCSTPRDAPSGVVHGFTARLDRRWPLPALPAGPLAPHLCCGEARRLTGAGCALGRRAGVADAGRALHLDGGRRRPRGAHPDRRRQGDRAGVDGGSGVWSAGGRLAYAALQRQSPPRPGGRVPIYITDAHGRNPRVAGRLAWDYQTLMSLHWLPGGRRVLVTTENQCSGTGLFAISPSGGAVQPLNRDQRDLEMPASSPDGRRIAYSVELYNCHTESEAPDATRDRRGRRERCARTHGSPERRGEDGRRLARLQPGRPSHRVPARSRQRRRAPDRVRGRRRAHGGSPVR